MDRCLSTRQKILEAALTLVSEKGYLGATTREISHLAGISELTLFRHFGAKEKLFEELLKTYTFLPKLKEMLPDISHLPCEQGLKRIGIEQLKTLKLRKSLIKIFVSEIGQYPDKLKEVHDNFINDMIETLTGYFSNLQKKSQGDSRISQGDSQRLSVSLNKDISPELTARVFLGMIFSYFLFEEIFRNRSLSDDEIETVVDNYVSIILHGVLAPSNGVKNE